MKLRSLRIERLPGMRDGLTLDAGHLGGRVQVLHGPNAIGKTSLVRALKALLWAEAFPREHLEIEATFDLGGAQWRARREGTTTRWTRDGAAAERPSLPAWEHADQLLIGLDDLAPDGARGFAEHLQRELGGGFDLGAVEGALRPSAQAGRQQARELEFAEKELRAARVAQEEVLRESGTLETLRADLAEARDAAARTRELEAARDLARARAELVRTESRFAAFPAGIADLRGTEAQELEELRQRAAAAGKELAVARSEEARLAREIAGIGLKAPIAPDLLDELDARAEELRTAEDALRGAREALARAETKAGEAARAFGPDADLEALARIDGGAAKELQGFAHDWEATTRQRTDLQTSLAALAAAAPVDAPDVRALSALEDWLATPRATSADARLRQGLNALAVVLALLGGGLAFVHLAFLGLAGLGALAFALARSTRDRGASARGDHEQAFQQTGETAPAAWTEAAVRARLKELRQQQASAERARQREEERQELAARAAHAERGVQDLERRRAALAARFGTLAAAPAAMLSSLVRACEELRAARAGRESDAQALARRERDRDDALARLNLALEALGAAAVGDVTAARVRASSLRTRSRDLADRQRQRAAQSERSRREEEAVRRHEEAIEALFARVGVDSGDEAELGRRLEQVGAWRRAREERDLAQRRVEDLLPRVDPELAETTEAHIHGELRESSARAADAEDLARRVTEIETRLKDARRGRALESALARRDACREALRAAFAATVRQELACALLVDVRKAHETTSRPEVADAADRLFTRFTRGRYSLVPTLSDGRLKLSARDLRDAGETLALEALSDGTRAQLLLAARLAYLSRLERETTREPLPVVLDDALATSDPERKREIGRALLEVARSDDRQLLILTADDADVGLLRPADAGPGEVGATDLGALHAGTAPAAARELARAPRGPRVPDLQGLDAERIFEALAEAGLSVSPLDPFRPVDDVHAWWVLSHDPALLQRLLEHRFETIGTFRNAARFGLAGLGARELAGAEPWIALAEGVIDAWRVGRGRPISADRVTALVTEHYREGLIALAKQLRGDAKAWIAALERRDDERTRNYKSRKIEEHRQALIESGHLDPQDELSQEEAWLRVLAGMPHGHGLHAPALRQRFELLWRACGGQVDAPPHPAQPAPTRAAGAG